MMDSSIIGVRMDIAACAEIIIDEQMKRRSGTKIGRVVRQLEKRVQREGLDGKQRLSKVFEMYEVIS